MDNEFVGFVAFYNTKTTQKSHVHLFRLPPSKHPSTSRCHRLTVKPARRPRLLRNTRKPLQTIHHVFEEIGQTGCQNRRVQFYGLFLLLNPPIDDRRHLLFLTYCTHNPRRSHSHSPDSGNWRRFERGLLSIE